MEPLGFEVVHMFARSRILNVRFQRWFSEGSVCGTQSAFLGGLVGGNRRAALRCQSTPESTHVEQNACFESCELVLLKVVSTCQSAAEVTPVQWEAVFEGGFEVVMLGSPRVAKCTRIDPCAVGNCF